MESPAILHCEEPAGGTPLAAHTREPAVALCRDDEIVWASDRFAESMGLGPAGALRGRSLPMLLSEIRVKVQEPSGSTPSVFLIADQGGCGSSEQILRVDQFDVPATDKAPTEVIWVLAEATPNEVGCRARAIESGTANPVTETELESVRRESSHDRNELIALLSHELRTPLTVISGYNKLLLTGRAGELSDEQRRYLEESQKSCQRLNEFVLDLLDATHDPSQAIAVHLVDRPVVPEIRAVTEFFLPLLEEKNLSVEIDAPNEPLIGRFDPVRIGQVLTNLLGNAVKYTKSDSEISVSVREIMRDQRPMIEVAMTDDGPGIAVDDSRRIFEPYVRSTDDRRAGGVGLGLAICRRILGAHAGDIWVEAAPGRGSRFVFVIPAVQCSSSVER